MNAWIPVASAAVSAVAVLAATLLTNLHARSVKLLDLRAQETTREADRRRAAAEDAYLTLQRLAKLESKAAKSALDILLKKVEPDQGVNKMKLVQDEVDGMDLLHLRFQLEAYFPEVHAMWSSFETHVESFIELNTIIIENYASIVDAYKNNAEIKIDFKKYENLPDEMRSTMHKICAAVISDIRGA